MVKMSNTVHPSRTTGTTAAGKEKKPAAVSSKKTADGPKNNSVGGRGQASSPATKAHAVESATGTIQISVLYYTIYTTSILYLYCTDIIKSRCLYFRQKHRKKHSANFINYIKTIIQNLLYIFNI